MHVRTRVDKEYSLTPIDPGWPLLIFVSVQSDGRTSVRFTPRTLSRCPFRSVHPPWDFEPATRLRTNRFSILQ